MENEGMNEDRIHNLLRILIAHRANFSVEFFAGSGYVKIRVRKTCAWVVSDVWETPVFKELKTQGFQHCGLKMLKGATPTAVVEYEFAPQGE